MIRARTTISRFKHLLHISRITIVDAARQITFSSFLFLSVSFVGKIAFIISRQFDDATDCNTVVVNSRLDSKLEEIKR